MLAVVVAKVFVVQYFVWCFQVVSQAHVSFRMNLVGLTVVNWVLWMSVSLKRMVVPLLKVDYWAPEMELLMNPGWPTADAAAWTLTSFDGDP